MATSTDLELGPSGAAGQQNRTLMGVAAAHWLSHVHIMVLPPLFPFMNTQFGLSYIQLGLAITLFGLVSGLTQAPMGALVDRFGARGILIAAYASAARRSSQSDLWPSYPMLLDRRDRRWPRQQRLPPRRLCNPHRRRLDERAWVAPSRSTPSQASSAALSRRS